MVDLWDFSKWAPQAKGVVGWLLGGTEFFKGKVQTSAGERLGKFISRNAEYQN